MGNGRSSPTTYPTTPTHTGTHKENAWRKKSLSTNSSPVHRKISTIHHLEVYTPLESIDNQHSQHQQQQQPHRSPSPCGGGNNINRKSVEYAVSPRQIRSSTSTPRPIESTQKKNSSERIYTTAATTIIGPPSPSTTELKRNPSFLGPKRRMSVDEQSANNIQRRISRTAKLSLASKEDLINSRRVSRAAIHFTETGDFGFTLVEQLKLTSYQVLVLQQTWPKIKSSVFSTVFRQLSYRNAKAKELFQKMCIVEGFSANKCCDMKEHVRCLIDLFDFAVADLNSPSKHVQDKCIQIGEIHYNMCGSTAAGIWDDLGNAVTEAISRTEPVRGKREALKAWISLISFLVDCMRGGYMAQCKRKSITRASGHFTSLSITPQNSNIEHCPVFH
uniref:Uncharacterized protein n=1 Tax=Panagrolaimus sp. PS1159 TaxID=55785 RepID=A0AC35F7F6_9BILA